MKVEGIKAVRRKVKGKKEEIKAVRRKKEFGRQREGKGKVEERKREGRGKKRGK